MQEIIEKFLKFEKKSYQSLQDLFDRIEDDREFAFSNQFSEEDKKLLGDRAQDRNMNICRTVVKSIVNTYITNIFKPQFTDQVLQAKADMFADDPDSVTACEEALTNSVTTGLGILVFSTDSVTNEPIVYSLADTTMVRLDPNSKKLNAADAEEAAVIELRSKKSVARDYDVSTTSLDRPIVDISNEYDTDSLVPVVTYYVKTDEGVTAYILAGNEVLDEVNLPYSYIPVIPVYGERYWHDGEQTYTGIVSSMRSVQTLINYCYRQLILRASKSPKNTWVTDAESIEGYEKYYQNSDKTLNPLLLYKSMSDDGTRQLQKPERLPNDIQYADIQQVLQSALAMVQSVTGVASIGLTDTEVKTATEVLTQQKLFNCNIRCYISHLKASLHMIYYTFAEEVMNEKVSQLKLSLREGPDSAFEQQTAQIQLTSFASYVTTDEDRRKLLLALCETSGNQYVKQFAKKLSYVPTAIEQQADMVIAQADQEIKQRDAQILELQQHIRELEQKEYVKSYSLEQQMLLNDQKFNQDREMKILDAKLEHLKSQPNLDREQLEVQKAKLQVDQAAVELQKKIEER
nr:MAG TPA: portal protein [Caudoviricetes sp.]